MGWKEMWEKYQVAAAFAEAGEEKMARRFLEETADEEQPPGKGDHITHDQGKGLLSPSPAGG